jgi:ornithine carbamoyltransferase
LGTTLPALRKFRGRHFLTDLDYTREELEDLLKLAVNLKALWQKRPLTPFLPGRHLAMIFEAASTRTRVSFENGFAELGGNAVYLRPGEIHLPGRESIADTARTLSQYNSAIEIRSKKNETVSELAEWSTVPVINGMDHDRHPCQSMSDALTVLEHAGTLAGVTFAYVGDAAHPCNSLSTTLTKLGLNVRIGNAAGYEMAPELAELAAGFAAESGASFLLTNDPL